MPQGPPFSEQYIEALVEGIYSGAITEMDLPESLYLAIADYLKKGLYKGFEYEAGEILPEDYTLLNELRENIYIFSGAKTFQQVREMTDHLTTHDGTVRPFSEFRDLVRSTFEQYNERWLRTEYETAIGQAQSAAKWQEIEKQKETLPLLRYSTIGDENTCDICGPLNGIIAPVDDPIWGKIGPINHFNCRCILEQLEKGKVSADRGPVVDDVLKKMDDIWKFNPGKEGVVFGDKHPYFTVPKDMLERARDNFGLPIPPPDK
jgi:SPP1 gp7 family putative phage head morphogenesis protein